MKAIWQGQVIAESSDTVVVEGNHYFPIDSIDKLYFKESSRTSVCPWKGTASYYSVVVNNDINNDAAWFYPTPKPAADEIKDRIAFWRGIQVTE